MLSFIQQEYLERVIAQSPKVAQDREVIELAVSKVRGHLKENHSDLWHKFLEYEVKRESGSAVYPSAMLILRDHDISRTIMNREYDSDLWGLPPPPTSFAPALAGRLRSRYGQYLSKHKQWLQTLDESERNILFECEDNIYPDFLKDAQKELQAANPCREEQHRIFCLREELSALGQLKIIGSLNDREKTKDLLRPIKRMIFEEARALQPHDMAYVRPENERQHKREEREAEARRRRRPRDGQPTTNYVPQGYSSMPGPSNAAMPQGLATGQQNSGMPQLHPSTPAAYPVPGPSNAAVPQGAYIGPQGPYMPTGKSMLQGYPSIAPLYPVAGPSNAALPQQLHMGQQHPYLPVPTPMQVSNGAPSQGPSTHQRYPQIPYPLPTPPSAHQPTPQYFGLTAPQPVCTPRRTPPGNTEEATPVTVISPRLRRIWQRDSKPFTALEEGAESYQGT